MSKALVQPYLFFSGNCEEALEFYRANLGAEIQMLMRYSESPEPPPPGMVPEGWDNKVMHASFHVGESFLMASDGCGEASFDGFSLSLTLPTEDEVNKAFAALAEGGEVRMPLTKTFWSNRFGMVQDKFGLGWMVTVPIEG